MVLSAQDIQSSKIADLRKPEDEEKEASAATLIDYNAIGSLSFLRISKKNSYKSVRERVSFYRGKLSCLYF